jgi:hypothetical protein
MQKFQVWISGDESSAKTVEAYDTGDAAERFVKKYESESVEYPVAAGTATMDIVVVSDDERVIFSVCGYTEPVYQATLML